jgi:hypothetical protein
MIRRCTDADFALGTFLCVNKKPQSYRCMPDNSARRLFPGFALYLFAVCSSQSRLGRHPGAPRMPGVNRTKRIMREESPAV